MTPDDGQGMMGWVKKDLDKLFGGLDEVKQEVARLSAKFERYVQPCSDLRAHLAEHERRESRAWGLVLQVVGKLITAAVAAAMALFATGTMPR